ncbi:hypothetical protein RHMOL_Rhmol06G0195800 [Rhododendron molle]|uniref:Uncharacterized protein n=1 Tax=Rhododendron molle TaxID=49168 RepID=A0ACC0NEC7_RHOML|nr:hypothetical protein RHMOL_Rhmol06G0195800 [Rhododendron molle]
MDLLGFRDDYNYNYPSETPRLADGFFLNPQPLVPNFSPGLELPLSAQSVAARNRRRKITEKTRELGKIVPGGEKMNTATMFQTASKCDHSLLNKYIIVHNELVYI